MSNKTNHRGVGKKRTETGPRYESKNPGAGSNSTHVARSRKKWKTTTERAKRSRERIAVREEAKRG